MAVVAGLLLLGSIVLIVTHVATGTDYLTLLGNAWHAFAQPIRTMWSGLIGLFQ